MLTLHGIIKFVAHAHLFHSVQARDQQAIQAWMQLNSDQLIYVTT